MGEILTIQPREQAELMPAAEMARQMSEMRDAMQLMAGMLRTTTEAMEALREQVRRLERVTGSQAAALNAGIRARAAKLCGIYRLEGREKAVAAMIRRDIRLRFGASSAKELPRCDYEAARQRVELWDDYRELKKLKEGTR